jgi:hypothetical protein
MSKVLRRRHQNGEPVRRVFAAVVIALAISTAACHGSKSHASAAPSASALTDERLLAIGRQHAQCLRDHGLTNVGEPSVWRGTLRFAEPQQEPDPAAADVAYKACKSIQDQVPASYLYQNWKPTPADVDAMGKLANCLRQHGFPEWPNPNGDGEFPIRGTSLYAAVKTDAWQESFAACRKYYDGPLLTVAP